MDEAQQIREKIDIASFISEYLPLKKAGRNFKANCPFHNEKTPSFVISPERQIWHCFGCGKGGDIFTFLMEYENMEFPEALRTLAKKAGVTIRETNFQKNESSLKEKIYNINSLALNFYHYILTKHNAGKNALLYLTEKRKLSNALIETFQIGFSPNTNSSLSDYLINKKGYKNNDLILAGVSFLRNGKLQDFFYNRIIFPLFDHRGNVTGFSGRGLDDKSIPKYLNTKETPVYHKGSMFFGLNIAKDEIKKLNDAIIVEGEFDAISLFKEGIKNAVAIKGTALTESQVALLSRFTPKVTLCLDQDEAGIEATKRSLEVLEKKKLTASIVVLKDAKDPDEEINKNALGFKKALKESTSVYDYFLEKYLSENNKDSAEGKKKITDNLLPLISNISNEVIKEHFLKKLSKGIDVSLESLYREIAKISKKSAGEEIIIPQKNKTTRRELLEEYLIAILVQSENPKNILSENMQFIKTYDFETPSFGKIIQALVLYFEKNEKFDSTVFSKSLQKELLPYFDTCFLFPLLSSEKDGKYQEEIKKIVKELFAYYLKEKIKLITDDLKIKEEEENFEEQEKLKNDLDKFISLLSKNNL